MSEHSVSIIYGNEGGVAAIKRLLRYRGSTQAIRAED